MSWGDTAYKEEKNYFSSEAVFVRVCLCARACPCVSVYAQAHVWQCAHMYKYFYQNDIVYCKIIKKSLKKKNASPVVEWGVVILNEFWSDFYKMVAE